MEMDKTFRPTTQWMAQKYDEMNKQLFWGELGDCDFGIFTSGKGSQGGVLGYFGIGNKNVLANRSSRRMFVDTHPQINIDKNNFVRFCWPKISLNGNYSGTEHGFLATLVHEMCHYYTFMYGYCPKQAHGREFKEIAAIVSSKSNGLFTVQRLATAEQMNELELDDKMKEKRAKRLSNKKASVTAIVVFAKSGKVKLTITSNVNLIDEIETTERKREGNVITTNDAKVIEFLFNKGYKKNMRTWRYWSLEDKPWLSELKEILPETSGEMLGVRRPQNKPQEQPKPKEPRRIFSINTSNGKFECDGSSYYTLKKALKERFPNMSDETINKIINNPTNYRMEENKINIKRIVESVLDEFMRNEFKGANNNGENIPIAGMNLGLQSPLENEESETI